MEWTADYQDVNIRSGLSRKKVDWIGKWEVALKVLNPFRVWPRGG